VYQLSNKSIAKSHKLALAINVHTIPPVNAMLPNQMDLVEWLSVGVYYIVLWNK